MFSTFASFPPFSHRPVLVHDFPPSFFARTARPDHHCSLPPNRVPFCRSFFSLVCVWAPTLQVFVSCFLRFLFPRLCPLTPGAVKPPPRHFSRPHLCRRALPPSLFCFPLANPLTPPRACHDAIHFVAPLYVLLVLRPFLPRSRGFFFLCLVPV